MAKLNVDFGELEIRVMATVIDSVPKPGDHIFFPWEIRKVESIQEIYRHGKAKLNLVKIKYYDDTFEFNAINFKKDADGNWIYLEGLRK